MASTSKMSKMSKMKTAKAAPAKAAKPAPAKAVATNTMLKPVVHRTLTKEQLAAREARAQMSLKIAREAHQASTQHH